MKSKKFFLFFVIIIFFFQFKSIYSDEIYFETPEILTFENGDLLKAPQGGKAITENNIEVIADEFIYNKVTTLLEAYNNVVVVDNENKVVLKTNKLFYLKKENKIYTIGKTEVNNDDKYLIDSSDVVFLRNKNKIISDKFTTLEDDKGNFYTAENFIYLIPKKLFRGDKVSLFDKDDNEYFYEDGMIDLISDEIQGKDMVINFHKDMFGNIKNEPRLAGNSSYSNKDKTIVSKGVFTTCKRREDDKCPPWVLEAREAKHDKQKKTIYYKDAWLKIYNVPVLYYPRFFHPDPSVKRKSGFLKPQLGESELLGSSAYIPYFFVISDSNDLTFKPRMFNDDKLTIQTEYRHVTEKTQSIFDVSLTKGHQSSDLENESSRSHFFSNSIVDFQFENFDRSDLEVQVQKTTNDTYLDLFELYSPLIEGQDTSTLNSFIDFNLNTETFYFNSSFNMYENLQGLNSDRYQYVFPAYDLTKVIQTKEGLLGSLSFNSTGSQNFHSTNIVESRIINNLSYLSQDKYSDKGILNNYRMLLKNVNSTGQNSTTYKDSLDAEILSSVLFSTSYPLMRNGINYKSTLSPKLSLRYSPSTMKNLRNNNERIDINNIWSFSRISASDTVESGQSLTVGTEFTLGKVEKSQNFLNFSLATNFRDSTNERMPSSSTLGNKSSNLVGQIEINPNKNFDLDYKFSLDNNFDVLEYNEVNTSLKVNNFITRFKYIEENDNIGNEQYIQNTSSYRINPDSSIIFSTRKNKKINLTEYYDLIYQYKNDCLTAALKYRKDFYTNQDLKPTEDLFFSITIAPIWEYESKNIMLREGMEKNILKSLNPYDQ